MAWVITILVVLAIMGGAGAFAVAVNRKQEKERRFMSVISRNKVSLSSQEESRDKQLARQRADIARKLKQAGADAAEKKKDKATIRELMVQAGFEVPVSRYWLGAFGFSIAVCVALLTFTKWPLFAVICITIAAFFGAPKFFLKWRAEKRQRKFLEAFADALDASVRLLQAGMPISEAVAMVAREFDGPLRDEMMRLYDNQKIGTPLGQAALEMAKRVPLTEAHMFATALQIQSETGSSLSEVLGNLAAVIRARFRLKRKVKALSSEAKASASIIAALPVVVSLGLYAVNEQYISILFDSSTGNWLLSGAIFWMLCGVLIMRQMINFRV